MKALMKGIIYVMVLPLMVLQAQAKIMSTTTLQDVKTQIEDILKTQKPEDILIAFDIDMTLIQPDHPALYYPTLKKYRDVYKHVFAKLTPVQQDITSTLTTQLSPQKLVEADTPELIKALQDKGIKVIALTASLAGRIKGFKEQIIVLRKKQLQQMGLAFGQNLESFPDTITFVELEKHAGGYPMFYQGILSSNGEGKTSKGDVLLALFRYMKENKGQKMEIPKIVLLIDDKKKHLETVEEALKTYNSSIQFIGFYYKGAYKYLPHVIAQEEFRIFWDNLASQAKDLYP